MSAMNSRAEVWAQSALQTLREQPATLPGFSMQSVRIRKAFNLSFEYFQVLYTCL